MCTNQSVHDSAIKQPIQSRLCGLSEGPQREQLYKYPDPVIKTLPAT